jgi:hypothetical protein
VQAVKKLRCLQKTFGFIKKNRNADPKDRLRQALRSRAAKFFLKGCQKTEFFEDIEDL